ncbi:hypothetical protein Henu6_gp109 [Acinetobacter phage Henu6]|uniref:Uncharacterized protein n=3 Tax=Caudoviricetes TaxID=2731619 RepID=A0A410T578_9CAUD|nr:hypothetical protein Henu6_gp109 [Acinetobacter phage Henu6]
MKMQIEIEFGYMGDEGSVKFEPAEISIKNITTNVSDYGEFHGFDEMKFTVNLLNLPDHQDKLISLDYENISKLTVETDKNTYVFLEAEAKYVFTNASETHATVTMHPLK